MTLLLIAFIGILTGIAGYAFAYIRGEAKSIALREQTAELRATLEHERASHQEKQASLEKDRENLNESFAALASKALKHNSGEFLKLAEQNLKQFQVSATSELDKKEQSIADLVKPIREALDKTESSSRNGKGS